MHACIYVSITNVTGGYPRRPTSPRIVPAGRPTIRTLAVHFVHCLSFAQHRIPVGQWDRKL